MASPVLLTDDLHDRVRELARRRGTSTEALTAEALQSFVEREELRQEFYAEALESLEHFRNTGLHVTGDEMFDWLRSWGKPDEMAPPTCHT